VSSEPVVLGLGSDLSSVRIPSLRSVWRRVGSLWFPREVTLLMLVNRLVMCPLAPPMLRGSTRPRPCAPSARRHNATVRFDKKHELRHYSWGVLDPAWNGGRADSAGRRKRGDGGWRHVAAHAARGWLETAAGWWRRAGRRVSGALRPQASQRASERVNATWDSTING